MRPGPGNITWTPSQCFLNIAEEESAAGYDLITLVVDSNMPDLIRLYESVGFLRMTYTVKRQNARL